MLLKVVPIVQIIIAPYGALQCQVATGVYAAREYLWDFWGGKGGKPVTASKVPLPKMEGYNEALEKTQKVLEVLGWLTMSWMASSALALLEGY